MRRMTSSTACLSSTNDRARRAMVRGSPSLCAISKALLAPGSRSADGTSAAVSSRQTRPTAFIIRFVPYANVFSSL